MNKNIIVTGVSRAGKTTLATKIANELNYNLISIDDMISALEAYPNLNIHHDGDMEEVSKNFVPFLKIFLKETVDNKPYYEGQRYVIEGTYIDFEEIIPFLNDGICKDRYEIIGLVLDNENEEELFDIIKNNDTEDEWTYWCDDEELKGNVRYFIERNKYFKEKFNKYNIKTINSSINREEEFNKFISLYGEKDGKKNTNKM
ncbi:MAG: ATP-binding protein [Lactobacillales bacterium]|nr:ATP-binding protein [Lactobacillales bacterium]